MSDRSTPDETTERSPAGAHRAPAGSRGTDDSYTETDRAQAVADGKADTLGDDRACDDAPRNADASRGPDAAPTDEDRLDHSRPDDTVPTGAGDAESGSGIGFGETENAVDPEQFAAEHDPAKHDIAQGEEFRQPGDWTAEDGEPQVQRPEDSGSAQSGDSGSSEGATGEADTDSPDSGTAGEERSAQGGGSESSLDEVRDGGYGVGSAASLHDGRTPLGHPIKAWHDTQTYVTPEHWAYDEAQPHVWFTDPEAAERAGFRHVD